MVPELLTLLLAAHLILDKILTLYPSLGAPHGLTPYPPPPHFLQLSFILQCLEFYPSLAGAKLTSVLQSLLGLFSLPGMFFPCIFTWI